LWQPTDEKWAIHSTENDSQFFALLMSLLQLLASKVTDEVRELNESYERMSAWAEENGMLQISETGGAYYGSESMIT
jgi:hypothetical protein